MSAPTMSRDLLIEAIVGLRRASIRGHRAPYKPLVLLWALGRLWTQPSPDRLVLFDETREAVRPLFEQFGRLGDHLVNVINPLWRLQTDGDGFLWECSLKQEVLVGPDGVPSAKALIDAGARFGLTAEVHELLLRDVPLRLQAGQLLASQVCPLTLWDDLFGATGVPYDGSAVPVIVSISPTRTREMTARVTRSPRFRVEVLDAYQHRCAVCGSSPQVLGKRFGVEAAHIQWVTEDGPDEVPNGLALCVMHHRGLDRGAFTLTDQLVVEVSRHLNRDDGASIDHFWRFEGHPIAAPVHPDTRPRSQYIDWHRSEVFAAGVP